ncbi:hypothetical protein [Pedobacter heparinus]|uniref:hypothetical protein n=1 Tax=Pedobacter heparinus TaxID=984 RepID=UPI00292F3B8F|nr:hypothetical protein [Pedobacter heparinus]
MKTLFLFIAAALIIAKVENSFAGNFYSLKKLNFQEQQDTIKFLEKVNAQRSKYHGKDLNTLLKDLKLEVKSYTIAPANKPAGPVKTITLYFQSAAVADDKIKRHRRQSAVVITFENAIINAYGLYLQSDGEWTDIVNDAYGKLIIKNITVRGSNQNR